MNKTSNYRPIWIVVISLAVLLRLGLALVNREANDNHLEPVRMIIETQKLPVMGECRECFHPKLFYVIDAALLQGFGIHEIEAQTVFLQLVNLVAGALSLVVIYKFIQDQPTKNESLKLLTFALVALNPKLIAIHSQVSNDTFVILFSTLALFVTDRFLKQPERKTFALLLLFSLLAVSTKATGWIVFLAIFLSLLAASLLHADKRKLAVYASCFFIAVIGLTALNPLSQFITNFQKFGSPVITRDKRLPFPDFFQPTSHYKDYYFRPGIVSIRDGFFTFKLIDLLEYPLITNGEYNYPPQRTSFWTMLYADANSLHFQNWPPSWGTQGIEHFTISRWIFILALLPTLIFIAGFGLALFSLLKALTNLKETKLNALDQILFLLAGGGTLAFLMLASLLYRDFAFIKLVYILPGLLAFTWLFLRGVDRLFTLLATRFRPGLWLIYGWLTICLGFYIWDVLAMISQLSAVNLHF